MRRFAKIFIGIVVVLVALMALVPVFVKVDDYRPKIVSVANEHLNGKLELGKLSLSLWGQIKVNVDGAKLSDAQGREVLSVKDVFFHVPFTSVFSGAPLLTLKMDSPHVFVVKDKAGKLNVLKLVKTTETAKSEAPAADPQASPTEKGKATELPGLAKRARLGIEMKKALLSYEDQKTDLKSQVKDLNVLAKDISLTRAMTVEVSANIDTTMGKTMTVKGPVSLSANVNPTFAGSEFKSSELSFKVDLNSLEILMPGLFEKTKGIVAEGNGELSVTNDMADLKTLKFKFHNVEVNTTGKITGFTSQPEPTLNLSVKSNQIEFKPWNALVPPLKEYDLGGVMGFEATVNGTSSEPRYQASVEAKALTAKAPNLKAQPVVNAQLKIITDQVERLFVQMKAPGNDLTIQGNVVSFTKPKVNIQVASTGMDLDQLINFPPPAAKKESGKEAPAAGGDTKTAAPGGKAAPQEDFDALLNPLRENKIARDTVATIKTQMAFIKAKNVKLSDVAGTVDFRNLVLKVDGFRFGVFGGAVKQNATLEMAPKQPKYRFDVDVAKLNLQEAVSSQFELFKNTLLGIASFKMDGSGFSLNPEPAKKNLNAKGSLKVENATFATIDVGKAVAEGLTKSINQIGEKIPPLKGKTIGAPSNIDSKYSLVSANFTISGGKFSSPDFVAKAEPNKGLDLKGSTEVNLIDYGLNASWEVVDTYNITKAKDLSIEQQGVRVEHILADSDGAVHIPIKVGGTAFKPEMNYTSIPEALGKVAVNNAGKAVAGKAKAEARKKIDEVIQKQAPPQVQDALKSLGGKLFGN